MTPTVFMVLALSVLAIRSSPSQAAMTWATDVVNATGNDDAMCAAINVGTTPITVASQMFYYSGGLVDESSPVSIPPGTTRILASTSTGGSVFCKFEGGSKSTLRASLLVGSHVTGETAVSVPAR
jgi:hypothetical protein